MIATKYNNNSNIDFDFQIHLLLPEFKLGNHNCILDVWTLGNMHWNCACDTYCAYEMATQTANKSTTCLVILKV